MKRSVIANTLPHEISLEHRSCDRCDSEMTATGWVPQPDGRGGLRRITVYRCNGCGRLFDQYWGFRVITGDL